MQSLFKKILSVFLVVVIMLCSAPLQSFNGLDFGISAQAATTVTSYNTGDIIEFGWYPQSKVTDNATITALNAADGEWISYNYYSGTGDPADGKMTASDYMRYKDVLYGGNKYRGVVFDSFRPEETGDKLSSLITNSYKKNTVYWFKYDPIRWRVLDPTTGMVMSETILDSQPYNNYRLKATDEYGKTALAFWGNASKTHYANNYENSSIREWLNDDFYNTAFSAAQQNVIATTTLNNSAFGPYYSDYDSVATNDKIYLLSWGDVHNTNYGFSDLHNEEDRARKAKGSDYAICQRLHVGTYTYSNWLLRSAGASSGYCCGVFGDGNVSQFCTTGNAYYGVRPAFNSAIFQSNVEDIDKTTCEKYISDHIEFVNSRIFDIASNDFRYATILWNNYHGSTSQAAAEFVYDIQEGFFETISFQGMSSLENPYDAIILDLLSSKSIKASLYDAVDSSAISVIDSVIGDLITTFQADNDWADDIDIASNFKDLLDLEATDYSSNKLYQSLDKLFDGKSTDQINSIFSKYDCYSNVLGNISDLAKGVDYFLEILKYTASIEAYYNASKEFKAILKEVADVMPSVNADYGQKFNETYNNYSCCIDYNTVMQNVLNHAAEEGFWLITDLMSDVLQDSALTFCKTALKMSESAAGTLVATLWAAETGFNLGNMITENDTLINCRRLLRANYMLDEAVHHVMCTHASALKINPSYEEALNFDAAFNLYKNLQLNSLELHQKYMKTNGSSFINFLLGKQDYFDREVQAKAVIINTWKTITCHDDNLTNSITHSKINTVVVACPTNVYVYCKSDGKLIASVINNEVNNTDNTLTVITESNEKAICLPDLNDYEIKIEATDTGNMTVGYTVGSFERPHYDRVVLFNDVELSDKSTFVLQVDSDNGSVFLVDQNQATVLPDSDTTAKHNYISKITTPATHTTEGVKTLTCFCGDSYTEVIAKTTEHNYTTVITDPTCTEIGYTTYTCICGDTYVADYVNVIDHSYNGIVTTPATHFAEGIMTYTCSVCGDSYTEEIAKIEHTASKAVKENEVDPNCTNTGSYDSVVYCDACGEELSRETKTIEALTHSFTKYEVVEAPKCGIVGKEVSSCDNGCSATNEKEIPALEHKDADGDYLCDNGCGYEYEKPAEPDTPDEPTDAPTDDSCDHICHKSGFMGFLWKIVRFFWKLFNMNPVCSCGVAHY